MDRDDLPNRLRGQQRIIFGEIENIYEFHKERFLPDLIKFCQNLSTEMSLGVKFIISSSKSFLAFGFFLFRTTRCGLFS